MKILPKIFICISTILMLNALAGCGFKLRSTAKIPLSLTTIYISPEDPFEPFQYALRKALTKQGVNITATNSSTTPALILTNPNVSERILAYGPNGLPQRYKLSLELHYQLIHADNTTKRSIIKNRIFTANSNAILSSNQERKIILTELRQETISELLMHLATIKELALHEPK